MSTPATHETRTRIVDAMVELLRSQGFNGTSLKQIATSAEAPTGSIYHFFPGGKDELGKVALVESGSSYRQLFELIADESATIVDAVEAFFEGAADAMEDLDYIDLCPIGTVAREIASTHDALRVASGEVFQSWTAALALRLEAAGIASTSARWLATTIVSALEGGFILARTDRSTAGLRATGAHMQRLVELELEAHEP